MCPYDNVGGLSTLSEQEMGLNWSDLQLKRAFSSESKITASEEQSTSTLLMYGSINTPESSHLTTKRDS